MIAFCFVNTMYADFMFCIKSRLVYIVLTNFFLLFICRWQALKGAIDAYRTELAGALEIHAFNRDVDDTKARISEKAVILANEDTGKDLTQVEALQRKQETIIRDMSAIEKKIKEHEKAAFNLAKKYPDMKDPIHKKQAEVLEAWSKLCDGSFGRKEKLSLSYTLHKFQADLRELEKWGEDIVSRMNASPLPSNTAEAEMLLQSHQEKKVCIVRLVFSNSHFVHFIMI